MDLETLFDVESFAPAILIELIEGDEPEQGVEFEIRIEDA
jgi:hypothetical protein